MEDFNKIREEANRSMSFEEYKNKNSGKVKEKKLAKAMKSIMLYPIRFGGAILGITKESLISGSSSGSSVSGGGKHGGSRADFHARHRVETPPPPSYDDIVRREIKIHQYMKDTNGIPNDLEK